MCGVADSGRGLLVEGGCDLVVELALAVGRELGRSQLTYARHLGGRGLCARSCGWGGGSAGEVVVGVKSREVADSTSALVLGALASRCRCPLAPVPCLAPALRFPTNTTRFCDDTHASVPGNW
jgi:hypothetical protein